MYYNRRTILKNTQASKVASPFNGNGKLRKGFKRVGSDHVKDTQGNLYLISDHK